MLDIKRCHGRIANKMETKIMNEKKEEKRP